MRRECRPRDAGGYARRVLARRLLIALAVVMALTALVAGLSPREPAVQSGSAPPAAPVTGASSEPLERTISAGETGQRVDARLGESLRLIVQGETLDSVAVGELGTRAITESSPAIFDLLLDVPGSYPITLLLSGRRLGVLEVSG